MTRPAPLDPHAPDYDDRVFERGEAAAEPHVALIGFQLIALGGSLPPSPKRAAEFGRFVQVELAQAYVEGTLEGSYNAFAILERQNADLRAALEHAQETPSSEHLETAVAIGAVRRILARVSDEDRKVVLEHVLEGRSL